MSRVNFEEMGEIDAAEVAPGKIWDSTALRNYAQAMKKNPDGVLERHVSTLFLNSLTDGDLEDLRQVWHGLLRSITPDKRRITMAGECLRHMRHFDRPFFFLTNNVQKDIWCGRHLSGFLNRGRLRTAWAIRQQMRVRGDMVLRETGRTAQP